MKPSQFAEITALFLGLAPAVPACSITDVAGSVDAGAGGALATGGAPASTGGAFAATGGDSEVAATGGAATGGAPIGVSATGGAATGGAKATGVATGGTGTTNTSSGGSTGTTLPTWDTPDGCVTGSDNSLFVGTWEGYIQGSSIGDEASSLRLNIVGANSNGLCGTVTMGITTEPVILPPATDPTEWYPPIFTQQEIISRPIGPILGVAYSIQKGQIAGQRTTFEISYKEIYKSWCALQTSYPQDWLGSPYDCLPARTGASMSSNECSISLVNGGEQVVPCSQEWFCSGRGNACSCNASGCTAYPEGNRFDLLFNGNQAMGTFDYDDTVVFNRVLPVP